MNADPGLLLVVRLQNARLHHTKPHSARCLLQTVSEIFILIFFIFLFLPQNSDARQTARFDDLSRHVE